MYPCAFYSATAKTPLPFVSGACHAAANASGAVCDMCRVGLTGTAVGALRMHVVCGQELARMSMFAVVVVVW